MASRTLTQRWMTSPLLDRPSRSRRGFEDRPHTRSSTCAKDHQHTGCRAKLSGVTLDQADRLIEDGVEIEVVPAWRWMA
jgi:hypothetical protein